VLALWSGLGYYARARNLHGAARAVQARHGGNFPTAFEALVELPGVGRSTAAAIAAFASGARHAILDGNVKRVLARHAGIAGDPSSAPVAAQLWSEAQKRLPASRIELYTQGMMDLGADICVPRTPRCLLCPVGADCVARIENRIGELPGRRRRAPARRRRIGMLVVLSHGEVLLEKRPSPGIWGGLWSLPETDAAEDPAHVLARDWGIEAASVTAMKPFEHAFTHYTLDVEPWKVQVKKARRVAEGRAATWLALDDLAGAALPAPVRRLLATL
jgi:A/G-specific adenine glycosylase